MPPRVPGLGESVDQQDQRSLAGLDDVEAGAGHGDHVRSTTCGQHPVHLWYERRVSTSSSDVGRPVQSGGVAIAAESSRGKQIYYGIIREIIELDYRHRGNMVLFRCDWVDNRVPNKWVKTD